MDINKLFMITYRVYKIVFVLIRNKKNYKTNEILWHDLCWNGFSTTEVENDEIFENILGEID